MGILDTTTKLSKKKLLKKIYSVNIRKKSGFIHFVEVYVCRENSMSRYHFYRKSDNTSEVHKISHSINIMFECGRVFNLSVLSSKVTLRLSL